MSLKLFVSSIPQTFETHDVLACFFDDPRIAIEQLKNAKGSFKKKKAIVSTNDRALHKYWVVKGRAELRCGNTLLIEDFLQGEALDLRIQEHARRRISLFKIMGEVSEA